MDTSSCARGLDHGFRCAVVLLSCTMLVFSPANNECCQVYEKVVLLFKKNKWTTLGYWHAAPGLGVAAQTSCRDVRNEGSA